MPRHTILILEDDAQRLAGFAEAIRQLDGNFQLRSWRDAHRFLAECHECLADAALISLDHDLNKEFSNSPDPGDGLEVATFLAKLPPICPVIVHTSNLDRVWSMHNEFRFAKWPVERVAPFDTGWIQKDWLPMARALLATPDANGEPFLQLQRNDDHANRYQRALLSLHGLALGDGIGEMMFSRFERAGEMIRNDDLPGGQWIHTDDTEMAISIVQVLRLLGTIHQDALARQFAWRYEVDPDRGYGSGARRQLRMIIEGADWREMAREAFSGQGSLGNGSAMRVAPLGAWFADDLDKVVEQARASAMVTHMHSEGVAGAIAIAVAAALAWQFRGRPAPELWNEMFNEVHRRTPDGETRRGIAEAFKLRQFESPRAAAKILGCGYGVTCPDTVPFTLWAAIKHLGDFREALAATASAGGDVDTNCAIVGGIVSLYTGQESLPKDWLTHMEPLPF